jgi:hypothetical protein
MYHETGIMKRPYKHQYTYEPSIINVWIKYGEPILHNNRETDLIMQT